MKNTLVVTRIVRQFAVRREQGGKALVAFITAGDPSLAATVDVVLALEEAGVDVVELGIPFSDPLADGRVNQASAGRALSAGATLPGVIDTIARIRERSQIPLMAYTYLNPILALGADRTLRRLAAAGLDGLLVLDLPVEEEGTLVDLMEKHDLDNIRLVTPTSPPERVRRIVRRASGFVYCVSRAGVTGAQQQLSADAAGVVARTRRFTSLPVALGFGIADPAQARDAARLADGVVVGSALVQRIHEAAQAGAGWTGVGRWMRTLVQAVRET
jgi:tryptophan synthase alpha chain